MDWLTMRNVSSLVWPTSTSPKSTSFSVSRTYGYLPMPVTLVVALYSPPSSMHTALATLTDASMGVKVALTCTASPGSTRPALGANVNGSFTFHSKSTATSPLLVNVNCFCIVSFAAAYPKSSDRGASTETTGRKAQMLTAKVPLGTVNSMKSSYCSRLMGRKVTSTVALMPGDSLIGSGNSMLKYLVAGSRYLTLSVLVLTFLTTRLRTYSPPGSHPRHSSDSAQSMPHTCDRS
mmetsp:Transcript_34344/g.84133  ORF Transcript_34344/g.84133 Transcript_34344/m.84133 type:complete len:235 (-) Transcript_34344:44-748(-)